MSEAIGRIFKQDKWHRKGSLPELFQEAAELGFGKKLLGYRCVRLMSVLSLLQNQALILQDYY